MVLVQVVHPEPGRKDCESSSDTDRMFVKVKLVVLVEKEKWFH